MLAEAEGVISLIVLWYYYYNWCLFLTPLRALEDPHKAVIVSSRCHACREVRRAGVDAPIPPIPLSVFSLFMQLTNQFAVQNMSW